MKPLLDGIDVVVHLAGVVDPVPDVSLMARVNVEGTRRVLDAAASVGVRRIVRISSATVYGAWPNNPVPLTETAALRPNPHFSPAVQGAEVERLLAEWRGEHPEVTVTTLRSAPVVGPGAERLPARILLGRPPLRVRGASLPVQVVHVDDLAAALALVATRDLPGVYNVAADGWIDADELRELIPGSRVPALPAEAMERMLARTWELGLGDIPPGVVPYLTDPWVIANDKLKAEGWTPVHSNADAILEAVASLPPRDRAPAAAAGAGAALVAIGAVVVVVRRRKRDVVAFMIENEWWVSEYGDPCRECGFVWTDAPEVVIADVERLPDQFDALLAGRTGDERDPDRAWSVKSYLFHVADNLRIFAERIEGVAAGASPTLVAYDQDELAAARHYEDMSLQSALWSVRSATSEWAAAARRALAGSLVFLHAERGTLTAAEITRGPAHDAVHHGWDVERTLEQINDAARLTNRSSSSSLL